MRPRIFTRNGYQGFSRMSLEELAERIADWASAAPSLTVFVYGSRVRGDHRPDSDVDVHFKWSNSVRRPEVEWWGNNSRRISRNCARNYLEGWKFWKQMTL
jgi:predicted nucleotidyltransferase